ncbi:MAG: glycosyltransferase family 87 protein [Candidatus Methylacidiphilales bacterium]|nr:glycosyltransferase family 87 protein [Candidatus Methylacidiphilales bacterium]
MKSLPSIFAGITLCGLLVVSFWIDVAHFSAGGSVDLRNRITGARLLELHRDPYHYKWKLPDSPLLCDVFNTPALPVSKVTATPAMLLLHFPLAGLPYRTGQAVWLIVAWLLLLGTGVLWLRVIPSVRLRWLWAAALTGFTYTVAWRLHADRGQVYVLVLFLLACWFLLTRQDGRVRGFCGGLVAGLLMTLRPPLLLLFAPFMALRCRGQIPGAVIGASLGIGLPMLWSASCWLQYHEAMQTWSELYRMGTSNPRISPQQYPAMIEGMPLDLYARFSRIPFADSSVFAFFKSLGWHQLSSLPVAMILVALIFTWFWLSRSRPLPTLLLGMAAWSFLIDFFLPAYRNIYNDVLILNILALALAVRAQDRYPRLVWLLLASCPLGWFVMATIPRSGWIIQWPTLAMVAASGWILLQAAFDRTKSAT